jgi:hypothetical protein
MFTGRVGDFSLALSLDRFFFFLPFPTMFDWSGSA